MKKYLTTNELAEMMGWTPAAIRCKVMRRQIPYRKVAGRLVFILSEIEEWIDQAGGVRPEEAKARMIDKSILWHRRKTHEN